MALAQPIVLYPHTTTLTALGLKVTSDGITETLSMSTTAGRYYWLSGDGQADGDGGVGGVGDLVSMLSAALNGHSSGLEFDLSLDADNRLTIGSEGDFQILWGDAASTLPPEWFGFTAATYPAVSGQTTTSPNVPLGCWRPGRPPQEDGRDRQAVVGSIKTSLGGLQRAYRMVLPSKVRDLTWGLLPQSKALHEYAEGTAPTDTFEDLWTRALTLGIPVRYYEDRAVRTATSYGLYALRDMEDPLVRDERFKLRWATALRLRRAD